MIGIALVGGEKASRRATRAGTFPKQSHSFFHGRASLTYVAGRESRRDTVPVSFQKAGCRLDINAFVEDVVCC